MSSSYYQGAGGSTEGTQLEIKARTDKIPDTPAQEHSTAASPHAARLSDGIAFYKATTPADTQPVSAAALPLPAGASTEATLAAILALLPPTLDAGALRVAVENATITATITGMATEATLAAIRALLPTSLDAGSLRVVVENVPNVGGTVNIGNTIALPTGASSEATLALIKAKTDNIDVALSTRTKPADTQTVSGAVTVSGTVAVSNSFALDATLTGGTQQAQVKSGVKGASAAALVTSTANGADHQGLDVQIQNASLTVGLPSNAAQESSGNLATLVARTPALGAAATAASTPVSVATDQGRNIPPRPDDYGLLVRQIPDVFALDARRAAEAAMMAADAAAAIAQITRGPARYTERGGR